MLIEKKSWVDLEKSKVILIFLNRKNISYDKFVVELNYKLVGGGIK